MRLSAIVICCVVYFLSTTLKNFLLTWPLARASLRCFNVRDEDFKERYILQWIERFSLKGAIFHDAKTCPYNSNSRFGLPQRLSQEHGVPFLVINGDLNDLRCFSDEQAKTNIEAFVEQFSQEPATMISNAGLMNQK